MVAVANKAMKVLILPASAVLFVFLSRYWLIDADDLQPFNAGLPWLLGGLSTFSPPYDCPTLVKD